MTKSPGIEGNAARFEEPWQVRAFAIVNLLVERGALTGSDWSNCLGSKRRIDSPIDRGYWHDWLETVEDLLRKDQVLTADHIDSAIEAIVDAREHRHAAVPEPLFVDLAKVGEDE